MKSKLSKFTFSSTIFILSILLNSCGPKGINYYARGNSRYVIKVDSYGSYDLKDKTFIVASGMNNVSDDDLKFKEFSSIVNKALVRQGAIKASNINNADILILVRYGISDPNTYQEIITTPIIGKTGVASSTTKYGYTLYGNLASQTTNSYNYGVTGSYNTAVNHTDYTRYCTLNAYDVKSKSDNVIWKTNINSTGSSGDLRKVFKYLINGSMDLYGVNTGEVYNINVNTSDNLDPLLNTKVEHNRYIQYSPRSSDNSSHDVTEVQIYNNLTRIYFRTFGNKGSWFSYSKNTYMVVDNNQKLVMTGSSTQSPPNKFVFSYFNEAKDYYIEFPSVGNKMPSTIKIVEPIENGFVFEIQL